MTRQVTLAGVEGARRMVLQAQEGAPTTLVASEPNRRDGEAARDLLAKRATSASDSHRKWP